MEKVTWYSAVTAAFYTGCAKSDVEERLDYASAHAYTKRAMEYLGYANGKVMRSIVRQAKRELGYALDEISNRNPENALYCLNLAGHTLDILANVFADSVQNQ
jgi:hypothetical protein